MQSFLDIDKSEDQLVEEYVSFLSERGYVIIPPGSLEGTAVKNPTTLVDLFYSMLQFHNRTRKIHYSKATKKDIGLARKFIDRRKEVCGNKKQALRECSAIVKCVIENEDLFCFSQPLHSFSCFGNDTMKWVTDRAISIINGENYEANERDYKLLMAEVGAQQERDSLNCLDDKIEQLKSFLGDSDAEEEE